jgi:hypothetical protein
MYSIIMLEHLTLAFAKVRMIDNFRIPPQKKKITRRLLSPDGRLLILSMLRLPKGEECYIQ